MQSVSSRLVPLTKWQKIYSTTLTLMCFGPVAFMSLLVFKAIDRAGSFQGYMASPNFDFMVLLAPVIVSGVALMFWRVKVQRFLRDNNVLNFDEKGLHFIRGELLYTSESTPLSSIKSIARHSKNTVHIYLAQPVEAYALVSRGPAQKLSAQEFTVLGSAAGMDEFESFIKSKTSLIIDQYPFGVENDDFKSKAILLMTILILISGFASIIYYMANYTKYYR